MNQVTVRIGDREFTGHVTVEDPSDLLFDAIQFDPRLSEDDFAYIESAIHKGITVIKHPSAEKVELKIERGLRK